jgi:hypothetical protein
MAPRRFARRIIFASILGILCDFALAAWLGWRPAGVVTGATFVVPAGDSTFALHWEGEFGRQSVECSRHGPPLSISELRTQYAKTYPDALEGGDLLGLPASALLRADVMLPSWASGALTGPTGTSTGVQAVGFPSRSYCRSHAALAPRPPKLADGTLFQHPADTRRAIPCIPIARGVVINTSLWALLWMPLLIGVPIWRRRSRARRGRCTQCAYDLRGDFGSGCPECGWNRAPALVGGAPTPVDT